MKLSQLEWPSLLSQFWTKHVDANEETGGYGHYDSLERDCG